MSEFSDLVLFEALEVGFIQAGHSRADMCRIQTAWDVLEGQDIIFSDIGNFEVLSNVG